MLPTTTSLRWFIFKSPIAGTQGSFARSERAALADVTFRSKGNPRVKQRINAGAALDFKRDEDAERRATVAFHAPVLAPSVS